MRVGLIGKGTVGTAVYKGLERLGHTMSFVDPAYPETKLADVLSADCVFICVPTDQAANGDCDTSIVETVVKELADANYTGLVAIKSTVTPGTSDKLSKQYPNLKICSVPEFLRAKTAYEDFVFNHDLLIIGSHREEDYAIIETIHSSYPINIARVKPVEAEITKYFNNVHHAIQITFANIAYEVCGKLGGDYSKVYEAITKRECFNPAYLDCAQDLRGFGGHCLPKDTSAWNNLVKSLGLPFTLIQAALDDNKQYK